MAKLDFPDPPKLPDGIEKLTQIAQKQNALAKNLRETLTTTFSSLAEFGKIAETTIAVTQSYWSERLSSLRELVSGFISTVSKWTFPAITEEEKEQLIASSRLWGTYGWTHIPEMPFGFFEESPTNIKAANTAAMAYCSDADMEHIFNSLRNKRMNHTDLESAIFCYHNKQYKACSLILCGLIESRLIRLRKGKNRPVGAGAVNTLIARYEQKKEPVLYVTLFCVNLLSYLEVLFEKGYGFITEPDTINRNFIGHGMNKRTVRKRDCIQLFLGLYNLIRFFELGL